MSFIWIIKLSGTIQKSVSFHYIKNVSRKNGICSEAFLEMLKFLQTILRGVYLRNTLWQRSNNMTNNMTGAKKIYRLKKKIFGRSKRAIIIHLNGRHFPKGLCNLYHILAKQQNSTFTENMSVCIDIIFYREYEPWSPWTQPQLAVLRPSDWHWPAGCKLSAMTAIYLKPRSVSLIYSRSVIPLNPSHWERFGGQTSPLGPP